jgi:hypothetical protein
MIETTMASNAITDLDITSSKVTFRLDGKPMAIVRVPDGNHYGWRVQFPDAKLSSGVFANPERAILWIAAGQPVRRSDETHIASSQDTAPLSPTTVKPRPKSVAKEDSAPDPEWQPIKQEPRRGPVWNGSLSSSPGAPVLLDPRRLVRQEPIGGSG